MFLKEKGLYDEVEIIDVAERPYEAIVNGVISVPAIFVDGKIIATGHVDFDTLYDRITTKRVYADEDVDAKYGLKQVFIALLDSLATAAWVYLREDIKEIIEYRVLIEPTIGIVDWDEERKEKYLNEVYQYFLDKKDMFMKTYKRYFFKNISKNFIREQVWLYKKLPNRSVFEKYTFEVFVHWLSVRGAIGRVGMKLDVFESEHKIQRVRDVYNHIKENFDSILNEVKKEQERINEMQKELDEILS